MIKPLLQEGNSKLGASLHTFSLPIIKTCPGRTSLCEKLCYGGRGRFLTRDVQSAYERNYQASLRADFAERLRLEIRYRRPRVVRIHAGGGDFYSIAYLAAWLSVIRTCPEVRFFAYTRSWRALELLPLLKQLAQFKNVRLFFSVDRETGRPIRLPKRVRLAWLAETDQDLPPFPVDLVFRNKRRGVRKRLGAVLACPAENGVKGHIKMTCERCRLCVDPLESKDSRRLVALPLAG